MKILFFALMILLISCNNSNDKRLIPSQPIVLEDEEKADGEILFKNNCANCHKPDKDFTGPALKGPLERWAYNKKAMYAFIRNPAKSISKNTYAKKRYEKWKGGGLMTAFPQLSDKELDAIMSYCDNYNLKPVR